MNMFVKPAMVLGLAGALALGAMTPSEARGGRTWAAAGVGFAAGALIGAAAANANNGYYYNEPAYGYGYAPGPVYYDTPAYYSEPSYGYAEPAYGYAPAPRYYAPRQPNSREQQLGAGGG